MALGLGALQTVLEEGNRDDWFGSPFIVRLAVVAAVSLGAVRLDRADDGDPLINLRLLARRNFGLGTSARPLGVALYGSVFILPLYLVACRATTPSRSAGAGLDRPAATPGHSAGAAADERIDARCWSRSGFALFAQLLHEHRPVARLAAASCFCPISSARSARRWC